MDTPLQQTNEAAIDWPQQVKGPLSAATRREVDLVTAAVAAIILGGYVALTWFFRELPLWLAVPLSAVWLAWYGSLQHETIHDHPTRSRYLNRALGSVPLALWLPYRVYRVTHLLHHRHRGRHLTDVALDPESFFDAPGAQARRGFVLRSLHRINCTLAGRLLLGPALTLARFWSSEARLLVAGKQGRRVVWLRHGLAVAGVLLWVTQICHIPALLYLVCVVYPSIALTHLRSFAEHRAHADPALRTVTVETNRLWSLLFLNNNLHIAHHAYPELPWHQLPAAWARMRRASLEPELLIAGGYRQVAREFLWKPVISVEHPGEVAPAPPAP